MKTIKSKLFMILAALSLAAVPCHALTITYNYVPVGTNFPTFSTNNFGISQATPVSGGFLHPDQTGLNLLRINTILVRAGDYWGTIFTENRSLTIDWGFCLQANLPTGANAGSYPTAWTSGGQPSGNISRGSLAISTTQHFFIDYTPTSWSEYPAVEVRYIPHPSVVGNIEYARFTGTVTSGNPANQDLYSIFLHEIGHLLGMSTSSGKYNSETSADHDIDVTGTRPIAGVSWNVSGSHLSTAWNGTVLQYGLMRSIFTGRREWPTQSDISCIAQIQNWYVESWGAGGGGMQTPDANWIVH